MQRLSQVPGELELQQEKLLAMYRGKLAEQFVAQELLFLPLYSAATIGDKRIDSFPGKPNRS